MKRTDFYKVLENIENQIDKIQREILQIDEVKVSLEEKLNELTQAADYLKTKVLQEKNQNIDETKIAKSKSFLEKYLSPEAKNRYNPNAPAFDQKMGLSSYGYTVWDGAIRRPAEERYDILIRRVLPTLGLKETQKRLQGLSKRAPSMFGRDCGAAESAYEEDLRKLKALERKT